MSCLQPRVKNEASRILLKCLFALLTLGIMCHHKDTWIENLWRIVSFTCEQDGENTFSQPSDGKAVAVSVAFILKLAEIVTAFQSNIQVLCCVETLSYLFYGLPKRWMWPTSTGLLTLAV